jgi:t-SNARE complex subunit (syntaxin)
LAKCIRICHEEGYQEAVLKYEGLLQEAIKQVEEEKKRAEEQKKQAEQEKQRLIKSIQKMRTMGASDKEIEETLEIKLKDYE